jgi:phenylpropionate dioxygenase-like ring-hydroxylating dioxygenase large terminal subunit
MNFVFNSSMKFVTRRTYSLNCNWKVFADNYLDGGYHVPFAHPTLVADGVDMKKYETTIHGEYVSIQTVNGGEFTRDKNTVDKNIPSSSVAAPMEKQSKRSRRSEAKRKKAAMNKTARRKAANATGTDGTNNDTNGDSSSAQLTRLGDSALYAFGERAFSFSPT